jgi:tRNA threonylcarbamoyladenosine biosynthesis protein TsaE
VLRAGDLVILSGGLGAGKTTLTKGIGDGLGVRGPITSPTFVIARVHPPVAGRVGRAGRAGRVGKAGGAAGARGRAVGPVLVGPALVHADAYRLGSALELDDLDLDTDVASAVTVVEWGEGLAEGLSADRLEISIAAGIAAAGADGADADPDADPDADDKPRTVLISAVGERWEGVKLPLAGLADRL